MLRAVLLGVVGALSISAVASCKKADGTAAAVGVAAGKVIEVKGAVTVKHGDATKPLAANDTVEADDTVITGADGSVVIELAHNLVRWELGANKQQKVRDSIAWQAPKNTGPAANVDQDTAAAGRPAERSAVGTTATAVDETKDEKEEKDEKQAPPAPPEAEAAPSPAAPSPAADEGAPPPPKSTSHRHSSRHREAAAKKDEAEIPSAEAAMAAPSVEPAQETMRTTRGATRGGPTISAKAAAPTPPMAPGGGAAATASASGGGGDSAATSLIAGKQSSLKACLAGHTDPVTLTVTVTNGKASVKLTSKSAIAASLDACMKKVVGSLSFSGNAHASTTIKP